MMDALQRLVSKCKCEVSLTINECRNYDLGAEAYLTELFSDNDELGIDAAIKAKMIENNTVVRLIFFDMTPVGSYTVYHYDLDGAVNEALDILKAKG